MRPVTVRTALCSVVLALCAAGPVAVPAQGSAAAAADPPEIRIGSYNIRAGVSLPGFKDAVSAFKPNADVAGLQEIGSNDRNKWLLQDNTWGYYRPPQLQQNPIIWDRDRFDVLGARGFKIADQRDLGNEYTGGEAKGDSYATIVRLQDRETGRRLSFINVHLVRGAVKGGLPVPDKPKLFGLYVDQVAGTVRATKAEQDRTDVDQVFVLGDFNVGFKADFKRQHRKLPFKRFKAIGYTLMWQGSPYLADNLGTHNDALIDQVWSTTGASGEVVLRDIKESDHWPAVATYVLPDPAPGYVPTMGTIEFRPTDVVQLAQERDGGIRQCDLTFDVIGDLAHGYADLLISGTAEKGQALRQGDYNIDVTQLYDTDTSSPAEICVDFQGDTQVENDETIVLSLVNPSGAVISGAGQAVGTIQNDD